MSESSYGRLRIQMNKAFDIGVESLSRSGGAENGGLVLNPSDHTVHSHKFDADGRINVADGLVCGNAAAPGRSFGDTANGGTFFLETFGCQMNDHDSEKVAGLLLSRGYRQVETPEAARMILYNTCSIREKAAQKVFSRLGAYRERGADKIIGVLGCVAQQEGQDIFKRAPWVSLVCGSASYRKLPEMLAELEAGNKRVTGLDNDKDETFETEITRW